MELYKKFYPKNITIDYKSNLFQSLNKINKNGYGIIFVCNKKLLMGVVSDGDIRRFLLKNNQINLKKILINKIIKRNFYFHYDNKVSNKKFKPYLKIIPIINKKKHLLGFVKNIDSFIPIYQPYLLGNEKKYINNAFNDKWISSSGEYVYKFEKKFQKFIGSKNALTVNNGTSALHLAYLSLDIKPGDEVILPAFTFGSPINVLIQMNVKPIFVDINYKTLCIDEELIERFITKKTKAIVIVHLYGNTCNINKVLYLAKKYNLKVVEDCAEAFGTYYNKKHVGNFGDVGTFSFFGNKTISTGEGGMVVFNNSAIFKKAILLKNHGMKKSKNYFHIVPGYNFRMTNIQAAIGYAQLEKAKDILNKKKIVSNFYKNYFSSSRYFDFPEELKNTTNSYWLFVLIIKNKKNRDSLIKYLSNKGVDIRRAFYSATEIPIFSRYIKNKKLYPISDMISNQGVCLPSYPGLNIKQLEKIVSLINFFMTK
jgi:perosamine synthetase